LQRAPGQRAVLACDLRSATGRIVKSLRLSRAHPLSRCAFAAFPEQDRRGPWFYEVTPADRAKLHAVNLDDNPLDALPLREMAEAIDDPFDDEHPQVMIATEKKRGEGGREGEGEREAGRRKIRSPAPSPRALVLCPDAKMSGFLQSSYFSSSSFSGSR
jgi:hypothetical protein